MPVYNGSKYLSEAIESILNQTFRDYELLIIDDASKDNSVEIINGYNENRIRLIENKKNIGQAETLNRGLNLAKGKFIARIDQDDIALNKRLEKQVYYLESHPRVGVLGCHVRTVNEDLSSAKPIRERPLTNYENHWRLLYSTSIMHSSVMFHHKLFKKYGGYNSVYSPSEDYELWSRLSQYTEIHQLTDILALIRRHMLRSSVQRRSEQKEITQKIRGENISRLLINYVEPEKIMDLAQYLSGKRSGSKKWWLNISYTMMKMYSHFCYGKLMTKKEMDWISKDLSKSLIDIPIGYRLIAFKYLLGFIRTSRYNQVHLFNLITRGFLIPLLNTVRLR